MHAKNFAINLIESLPQPANQADAASTKSNLMNSDKR